VGVAPASFAGGPGTGKTTVARIVGRLLRKYELLERGEVREVGRSDLVAEFLGQTASKTEKLLDGALGGVLFIDEAYALSEPARSSAGDYGSEALAVLIAKMENHRHELCVIVAGYSAEMDRFLDANAGLASRISRRITFPDYSDEELKDVFRAMLTAHGLSVSDDVLSSLKSYVGRAKRTVKSGRWGNARSVRNILERGIENQSVRLRRAGGTPSLEALSRLDTSDFAFLTAGEPSVW
jgi:SpoVK/Ycf46/Vps4 family AAA+-type ATPase